MVEVATGVTGSGSTEQLPMLLQFPRILNSPVHICAQAREFSLLGYGDIIVPGFLVCFAHGFDLQKSNSGNSRPYFITSLIGTEDFKMPLDIDALLCIRFTLQRESGEFAYSFLIFSAYAVGLGGAFAALILSSTGQPALFYIVPCILLGIFTLGLIKRDVKALWRGGFSKGIEVPVENDTP